MASRIRKHDYTIDGSSWDLSTLSLSDVPVDQLQENPKARKVDLSNNLLVSLPRSFTTLTHLVWIDLSKNKLRELPSDFGNLVKLQHLDLYANFLTRLPLSFANLTKLRWLDLKGNPLDLKLIAAAGDCSNQVQCQNCALSVVKFMQTERKRVLQEARIKEMKEKEKEEEERRLLEAKKAEKEKRKAKNARRAARKAKERSEFTELVNHNDNGDDKPERRNKSKEKTQNASFLSKVCSFISTLLGFLILLISVYCFLAIGIQVKKGFRFNSIGDLSEILKTTNNMLLEDFPTFANETIDLLIVLKNEFVTATKLFFNKIKI